MRTISWFVGSLLLTWAAFAPALGQDSVPMDVRGDVVQVIRSQPFSVHAGVEAVTYAWTVPAGFKVSGQETADLIVEAAPEGTHTIKVAVLIVDFDAKKVLKKSGEITIIVGVKPPDPTPPPVPPVPVPADKRLVVIVRETSTQTPQMGNQLNLLRSGERAKYLRDKGHKLYVLDPQHAAVSNVVQSWVALLGDLPPPAIVIATADGKLITKAALPATADEILALLKANGG